MLQEDEIRIGLQKCIPERTRLAVVHSSLADLAPPSGPQKWPWLRAIRQMVTELDVTFAFPAFTFSFCNGQTYHYRDSRSETGVLADFVLELLGAVRTQHPIYSFVVIGPMRDQLVECVNSTTWGDDSVFAEFEFYNAQVVMLGCGWEYCTQFHRYEEKAAVPYRIYKTFSGLADFGHGESKVDAVMYVRDLALNCGNDWSKLVGELRSAGQINESKLWRGRIEAASCADIARVCSELLSRDPWILTSTPRRMEYAHKNLRKAAEQAPLKIAVLGHSNLHFVQDMLSREVSQHIPDRRLEIYSNPYGQLMQQVVDSGSELNSFSADFTFFVDRIEDLMGVPHLDAVEAESVLPKLNHYISAVRQYRETNGGWIFVNRFVPLSANSLGAADESSDRGPGAMCVNMSDVLSKTLQGPEQLHLFNLAHAANRFDRGSILDQRLWFLGRFPFSEAFSRYLALRYTGLILAATGRTARVLVLDLDNTLWGGILGEDGISGLKIGGDYPGNTYSAFQKTLKLLSDRGIALAVCSKNDEAHALEAMSSLQEMLIRPQDLVAHRINWRPKWQNLLEICDHLNLGSESAMFIDDNPVERQQMRQQCPSVKVLELPGDPAFYSKTLLESPWLECIQLTVEDFQRVKMYRAREQIQALKSGVSDLTAFYASLGLRLSLNPLDRSNMQRAVQLVNKTNQFNATTRRYDLKRLEAMAREGGEVIVIGVEDRYSAFENIGVIILRWHNPEHNAAMIDSYLLSCRALGKGVEQGALSWLKAYARGRGATLLVGEIIETERNTPVRQVYKEAGFVQGPQTGQWCLDLTEGDDPIPAWLTIVDNVRKRSG